MLLATLTLSALQAAAQGTGRFVEQEGLLVVEAEAFESQSLNGLRSWYITSTEVTPEVGPDPDPNHAGSASGNAYIEILPDARVTHSDPLQVGTNFTNEAGRMTIVSYPVTIQTPGRYYVWVRAYSTGTEDNGVHVGLNGTWPLSGQRLQWCDGKNAWRWESRQRTDANHCGVPGQIWLDIETPGEHTIQFSMREDGFEFDRFLMTLDPDFERPDGAGPPASPRIDASEALEGHAPGLALDGVETLASSWQVDTEGAWWAYDWGESRFLETLRLSLPPHSDSYAFSLELMDQHEGQSTETVLGPFASNGQTALTLPVGVWAQSLRIVAEEPQAPAPRPSPLFALQEAGFAYAESLEHYTPEGFFVAADTAEGDRVFRWQAPAQANLTSWRIEERLGIASTWSTRAEVPASDTAWSIPAAEVAAEPAAFRTYRLSAINAREASSAAVFFSPEPDGVTPRPAALVRQAESGRPLLPFLRTDDPGALEGRFLSLQPSALTEPATTPPFRAEVSGSFTVEEPGDYRVMVRLKKAPADNNGALWVRLPGRAWQLWEAIPDALSWTWYAVEDTGGLAEVLALGAGTARVDLAYAQGDVALDALALVPVARQAPPLRAHTAALGGLERLELTAVGIGDPPGEPVPAVFWRSPWFGFIRDAQLEASPWLEHLDLGWLAATGALDANGFWFLKADAPEGYAWTHPLIYPWVFSATTGGWSFTDTF